MSGAPGPSVASGETPRSAAAILPLAASVLIAYAGLLAWLARRLDLDQIDRDSALRVLAAGSMVAGAVYLIGLFRARPRLPRVSLWWIGVVAMAARLVLFASSPLLESDYQRYLWDGAVVAKGINPYRHAPGDVAAGLVTGNDGAALTLLSTRGQRVLAEINHPHLTTIYPPVAQIFFAVAYFIEPFGISGWRVVLLATDALTALLLLRILKEMGLPASQVIWYAWNPLLLRETYSSLHMDVLVLPFILAAMLAGFYGRFSIGAALSVVGSAVKVWPIILLPLFVRPMLCHRKKLLPTLALSALLLAALWMPVLVVTHGPDSGFIAYGKGWQNNDGFFRAGIWVTERLLNLIHIEPWHSHAIMRFVSAALLAAVVASQVVRTRHPFDLPRQFLIIVGAAFFLSPTQFPWYWIWCLPLLALRPNPALLLYTALLPLYYVQSLGTAILWIEHLPVWSLLAWQAMSFSRRTSDVRRLVDPEASHA